MPLPEPPQSTPELDGDTLVLALNVFFTTKARTKMLAVARATTRRRIASETLAQDMLAAMDVMEKEFPPRQ